MTYRFDPGCPCCEPSPCTLCPDLTTGSQWSVALSLDLTDCTGLGTCLMVGTFILSFDSSCRWTGLFGGLGGEPNCNDRVSILIILRITLAGGASLQIQRSPPGAGPNIILATYALNPFLCDSGIFTRTFQNGDNPACLIFPDTLTVNLVTP